MSNIIKVGAISVMGFILVGCATSNVTDQELATSKTSLAAQTEDVSEWKTAAVKVSDGTEKVCKRTEQTGTRFKKKVCMTQAEWDNLAAQSQRASSEAQRRSGAQSNRTGG